MKRKRWLLKALIIGLPVIFGVVGNLSQAQVVKIGIELMPGLEVRILPVSFIQSDHRVPGVLDEAPSAEVWWLELIGDENMELILSFREFTGENYGYVINEGNFNATRATPLTAEGCSFVLDAAAHRHMNAKRYKAWIGLTKGGSGEVTIVLP